MDFFYYYSFPPNVGEFLTFEDKNKLERVADEIFQRRQVLVFLRNSKSINGRITDMFLSVKKISGEGFTYTEQSQLCNHILKKISQILNEVKIHIEFTEDSFNLKPSIVTPDWLQKMLDFHGITKRDFAKFNNIDESNVSSWTSKTNQRKMSETSKSLILNFFYTPKLPFRIVEFDPLIFEINIDHFLVDNDTYESGQTYTFRSKYDLKIKPIDELKYRSDLFNEVYLQVTEGVKIERVKFENFEYSYTFGGVDGKHAIGFKFFTKEKNDIFKTVNL